MMNVSGIAGRVAAAVIAAAAFAFVSTAAIAGDDWSTLDKSKQTRLGRNNFV